MHCAKAADYFGVESIVFFEPDIARTAEFCAARGPEPEFEYRSGFFHQEPVKPVTATSPTLRACSGPTGCAPKRTHAQSSEFSESKEILQRDARRNQLSYAG